MCSIAGIIGKAPDGAVKNMLSLQKHRAPDEEGIYKDDHIELGMGRLKIIDLVSPGLAPYREDHLVLSYNGEIYITRNCGANSSAKVGYSKPPPTRRCS